MAEDVRVALTRLLRKEDADPGPGVPRAGVRVSAMRGAASADSGADGTV